MAKVVLINPGRSEPGHCEEIYSSSEPLNVMIIAGYLEKHGVEVKLIDEMAGEDALDKLKLYQPDIVGIAAVTRQVLRAYRIADHCRSQGILTVMGGVHVSVLPQEGLQHCDIVVKGEGEQAMLDIAKGQVKSGIVTRDYIKDIDEIPAPARHCVDMDFYIRSRDRMPLGKFFFAPPQSRCASVITMRGCPFNCAFCYNSWRTMPVRYNSAERVIAEIEALVKDYGVNALIFNDDDLFLNRARLTRICEAMLHKGIKLTWECSARSTSVNKETLALAKRAGLRLIAFGFESGSQRILDILGKKATIEQNLKAIALTREAGILTGSAFMFGNPTETLEDIRLTRQFIKDNNLDSAVPLITTPYPGTGLWKWCEENKRFFPNLTWDDYDLRQCVAQMSEVPAAEIVRIAGEISAELSDHVPIGLGGFIKRKFLHPVESVKKLVREYKSIPAVIKRLRF